MRQSAEHSASAQQTEGSVNTFILVVVVTVLAEVEREACWLR